MLYKNNKGMNGKSQNKGKKENSNDMMSQLSGKLGMSSDQIANAAKSGDISSLTSSLSPEQMKSLNDILGDEKKRNELMASPAAQMLLKLFNK